MIYSVSTGQQGEKILMIDGQQSVCPFVNAIPIQGNVGQLQIMRVPCSTLCPLASLNNKVYQIGCGYDILSFKLNEK